MRFSLCLTVLATCAAITPARAADPAAERLEQSMRHQEWVDVKAGDRTVKAFVVYPEVKDKATAVIVIHEIFGLTPWVRSVADGLAEAGYIAIAPDLLSGTGPGGGGSDSYASQDATIQGVFKLPAEQVTADLDGVDAYAKGLDAASGKVAVAGFCWGGGKAFAYAAHNPGIAIAMPFYGPAPSDEELAKIKAPVYGFYGGNDARISAGLPHTTEKMKELGKTYEPVVYEGAGHGFMRAGSQPGAPAADVKAHDEAWARMKKLLAEIK